MHDLESCQLNNQLLRAQVGVSLKHRQRFVATHHADLNGVQAFFKQPSHRLMTQVVET